MKKGWTYRRVVAPEDYPGRRYMKKWCLEHHLIWWQATGKVVPSGCVVHHRNGDKADNRIENLELLTNSQHAAQHAARPECRVEANCSFCKKPFMIMRSQFKRRMAQSKTGKMFCSKRCGVLQQWASGVLGR